MSSQPSSTHNPIDIALREDLGTGDLTAEFFVDIARTSHGRIFAKERCVLAGGAVAAEVFRRLDPALGIDLQRADGDALQPGDTVLHVAGNTRAILSAERVALNFVQRLSGVATLTRRFVEAVGQHRAKILDTRKTTPGLRALEKSAVVAGGGVNHRFGLYDMVMVKDNHLAADAGLAHLSQAVRTFRAAHPGKRVELEADTLEQVRDFLNISGIDVILLDNMSLQAMAEAVRLGQGRVQFEASGGVTVETVAGIAATGVDYISSGALTHSARAVDFSLELL
jgi:nicotinate-nucleotide pyrophosphorylase (carboxylating)